MKKNKGKKLIILLACLTAVGAGGLYGVRHLMQNRAKEVEVTSVNSLNGASWIGTGFESQASGTVVSDVSQQVYVPEDRVIKEVFVTEGDKVKIGDKLITYDTTLLELDHELQELSVQEIGLEIKSAEADLQKLYNTTPVERSAEEEEQLGDDGSLLDLDFSNSDDQARRTNGERVFTASQESSAGMYTAAENSSEPSSAGADGQNAVTDGTDVSQGGGQSSGDMQTEDTNPETEMPQTPDTNTGTGALQNGTQGSGEPTQDPSADGNMQPSGTQNGNLSTEMLTPEELQNVSGDGETSADKTNEEEAEKEEEKPKMNQSLKKLFWFVKTKEVTEAEEVTQVDTREKPETDFSMQVSGNKVKIIPHFREAADIHFDEENTYALLIKGITLTREISGKLVGTAVIDGNDYPEIGGFTLAADPNYPSGDVARLTLAFHSGLTAQHEIDSELEDAYAEIELEAAELTGNELIFRVSEKETEDTVILLEKTQTEEPESESESEPDQEPESESESEPVSETETESESEGEAESEPDSEQESESETESEVQLPVEKLNVEVTWYHGTNNDAKWPETMRLDIYSSEDKEQKQPILTMENITGPHDVNDDADETETGDEEPETEKEMGPEGEPDTEVTETPETEPTGKPDTIIGNNSYSTVKWNAAQAWPEAYADVSDPEEELVPVVLVENYIPAFQWKHSGDTLTLSVSMKYLEPEESPLAKLDPLPELDYDSGAMEKYYKGSGTAEDPYVFFVTDGVMIYNTFVNWVLGFDEAGTTRLSDGYCVILEIRESDTITGAFIRSVGLDGRTLTEFGFGPGTYWIFSSDSGIVRFEEDIPDDFGEGGGNFEGGFGDGGFIDDEWEDMGITYTPEELAQAIKDKEREIRQLKLDEKEAKLKLKKYEKQMEESTVVSAVNGFVKTMNGDEKAGEAYMVLASEGGLYLQTTVTELDLAQVEKGDTLTASSWETMQTFTASITEINYFPVSTKGDYWSGNVNNSSYPVLAYIDDTTGLSPYEYVGVTFDKKQTATGGIYLPKAYIRSENGQSYVYKCDENGRLKKQFVRTGETMYEYVNIKDGLSVEDMIAFPYGKNVKEGAKTVEEQEEIYYY